MLASIASTVRTGMGPRGATWVLEHPFADPSAGMRTLRDLRTMRERIWRLIEEQS